MSSVPNRLSYKQNQSEYECPPGSILFNWKTQAVTVTMGTRKQTFEDCEDLFEPSGGEIVLLLDTIEDTIEFSTTDDSNYHILVRHANVRDKVFHFVADFCGRCQADVLGYQCFGSASTTRRDLSVHCATALARASRPDKDSRHLSVLPPLIVVGGNVHGRVSVSGSGAVTCVHSVNADAVTLASEAVTFEVQLQGFHVLERSCGLVPKCVCQSLHGQTQSDTADEWAMRWLEEPTDAKRINADESTNESAVANADEAAVVNGDEAAVVNGEEAAVAKEEEAAVAKEDEAVAGCG